MATIYGDTSTSLSCHQAGGDQFIQGDDGVNSYTAVYNYLYGDAYLMRGFARGGNDTILGGSAGNVAVAVARQAEADDVATASHDNLIQAVQDAMWQPVYPEVV